MIDLGQLVLLDTSVLVHLLRESDTAKKIETDYALSTRPERPLVCSIVEGELFGLVTYWNWGEKKLAKLDELLNQLVRVSSCHPQVVRAYVQLFAHLRSSGNMPGQNDLWIAASGVAYQAVVLTCDTDFKRIDPTLVDYRFIASSGSRKSI